MGRRGGGWRGRRGREGAQVEKEGRGSKGGWRGKKMEGRGRERDRGGGGGYEKGKERGYTILDP